MPVFERVRNLFQRKQEEVPIINHPLPRGNKPEVSVRFVGTFQSGLGWTSRDYEYLAQRGYRLNSDVYSCVSLIAQAAKQVKWDTSPGTRSAASLELLKNSGGPSFIEAWISYVLLSGNAYIEIGRNGQNKPISLYMLQPNRVSAKLNPEARYPIEIGTPLEPGLIGMWRVTNPKGLPYPVTPADMMHSKLFNPLDPVYGMAPLEAAMLRVDAQNEGVETIKRLFARGFAPGWIEAAKDSIWEETQVSQLKTRMRSSKEAGEELFLENATYHQIGFNPAESGVSEQQILTKRDIASVFHVPPQLIGDTQAQTYSNYQEARRALYMEAVTPLLEQFKQDWNRSIGKDLQSPLAEDKDSFDAIAAARAEATDRVQKLWTSGLITQNEARRDLEYDPVQDGDVFYAPANFLPLAAPGAESPAAAPPATGGQP